jgi:hypothetical protein
MFGKVLILLPNKNDRAEASKIDPKKYEIHFLHASDEVKDKKMSTFGYSEYLEKPGFLNNYVERAVEYVRKNGISGIMYGHDMSSIIASVVGEITGLPAPPLNSTFVSLHKYYSRQNSPDNLWYDYIDLDDSNESWKAKIGYPCFVKAPFLMFHKGCCAVENEAAMMKALADISELTLPFFIGYADFFHKYLDLKKFPLAVKNIVVAEELIHCKDQYYVESWVDGNGVCFTYTTAVECFCNQKEDIITGYVTPEFTLNENDGAAMAKRAEEAALRAGLLNTFFNVELWKIGNEFKVVEINSRCVSMSSATYTRMFGFSNYEAAIALACGKIDNIPKPTSVLYQQGEFQFHYSIIFVSFPTVPRSVSLVSEFSCVIAKVLTPCMGFRVLFLQVISKFRDSHMLYVF